LRDTSGSARFSRREFLVTAAAARQSRRPNLLLLLAGRWRAQTLGAAGGGELIAPNLDRLIREGVWFSRAYACCPLGSPARASILAGRFPHAMRTPARCEDPTLISELKRAGYSAGCIGDWGCDSAPGAGPAAIEFLRANIPNDFCLCLSLEPPVPAPERFARLYAAHEFRLRDNVPEDLEARAREAYALHYAQRSALDSDLGRLLRTLDETGLAQDTIVVFTSDHGDLLGSHGRESADDPREESARVPLVVRYPRRIQGGGTIDFLASSVDLAPALLALCGVDVPRSMQGRDLSEPILTGKGDPPESIYAEGRLRAQGEWRMLVRGLDKLVVNTRLEVTHLYNLGRDPYEMTNLATDGTQRRKRDELLALLRRWILRTGDRLNRPPSVR
jgi:arylsulfatase A-like enzyme